MRSNFLLLTFCIFSFLTNGQTPVVMSSQAGMTYIENFSDIANWGNNFVSGIGANRWASYPITSGGIVPDGKTTTKTSATFVNGTSGGIQKGTGNLIFLSTGSSATSPEAIAVDLSLDFTGVNAGTLSFKWDVIDNTSGTRPTSLKVYWSIDNITFTEITDARITDVQSPSSGSITSITLPSSFNNSSNAKLRFYNHAGIVTGSGNRDKIAIDDITVTAYANSPCVAPVSQPTSLIISSIGNSSINGSFTAASSSPNRYLILLSSSNTLSSTPLNGLNYALGDNIDDATVVSIDDSLSFTINSLNPSTTYYLFLFSMNNLCTGGPLYLQSNPLTASFNTTSGILPCVSPTNQPTGLLFNNISARGLQGSFTASQNADEYLIVRSTNNILTRNPINTITYNLKDTLGGGTVIGNNASTSFIEDSLNPSSTYYYYIYSIRSQSCSNGPVYLTTTPLVSNATTSSLGGPCNIPSSQPTLLQLSGTNNSISGTFTASPDADNYLVLYSTASSLSQYPANTINYSSGTVIGNATVVSNSNSLSFYQNGLSNSVKYYFYVFAENNNCTGGPKYNITSPLSQNFTTSSTATYNFYYGNMHAHSSYSDGNKDNASFTPANDYAYAKNSLGMDFLGISEHNHNTAGMSINNWPLGIAQAQAATNSTFVGLYGQEWGVISNGGHVLIYGIDSLIGWEANNYQLYVAKSDYTGSAGLFKILNRNGNAFASYAHPSSSDYNGIYNLNYNSTVDSAVVGCAVESGPAMDTTTAYNSYPSSMSYLGYYTKMLSKGYHLGPFIDHDTHYTNFGRANENRLVVLATSLSKANLLSAMKARRFYSTQDFDTKINFTVNNEIMGSIISSNSLPSINVSVIDPTAPSNATKSIKIMYGIPGSGVSPTTLTTNTTGNFTFTHSSITTGSSYYYYLDVTINGKRSITAPIWYTKTNIAASPNLIVGSISGFGKQLLNSTSTEKSFTVSGTNLHGNLTITSPQSFQISNTPGTNFGNTITLNATSGTLSTTTIYIRFNPTGLKIYSGNLICTSLNATTQNISVSGTAYITATACNSYLWNGTIYTTSGDKTFTTLGSGGIDSTATLSLTVNSSTSSTQNVSNCKSYLWNGTTYTSSGSYSKTYTNAAGCDSLATINLTINDTSSSTSFITNCIAYTWNGVTYNSSGIYSKLFTNNAGCDSIARLILTIKDTSSSTTFITICTSYTWNGVTYNSSGIYSKLFTNNAGCDSIARLVLTIKSTSSSSSFITNCMSYSWNGVTYTSSGNYTKYFTNSAGCDSVATLYLTISNSITPAFTQVSPLCSGSPFSLPVTSNDGITGYWSPSFNNSTTTNYIFYPDSGQCAITTTMTISILANATVSTGSASNISSSSVTINGVLIQGCSNITSYGIEYSSTNGFNNGTGTRVSSSNLSGNNFSSIISGLTASTIYYFKAYALTTNGSIYGNQSTFTTFSAPAIASGVVISQVYGGGGTASATYNADYVELHNNSSTAQDITGYKIMYGSTSGNLGSSSINIFTIPSGVIIPAGGYLLLADSAGIGLSNLPVNPDFFFKLTMSTSNGKVAFGNSSMINNTSYALQPANAILDFVGYGTANESEGGSASGALSISNAAFRKNNGCTETNNNLSDFTIATPNPRNSLSAIYLCSNNSALPSLSSTTLTSFGNVCTDSISLPKMFIITGSNLSSGIIKIAGLSGYRFSTILDGAYSDSLNLFQSGGTFLDSIFVKFYPTTNANYNGNITISGGSATTINIATSATALTSIIPTFNQLSAICNNQSFSLPTSSVNNITGTWAPSINTIYTTNYTFTPNNNQCASTATMTVIVKQPTSSVATAVSACNSYTWNGTNYTTSGIKTFTTTNAAGCDSTVTLNLTIKQPTSAIAPNVSACSSYTWNGTNYTTSGVKTFTTTNAAGCDSTVTLNLTIKQPTYSNLSINACDSFWCNGEKYTTSGIKTFTTTNAAGCDSTVTLNLIISISSSSTQTISIYSNSLPYQWNGNSIINAGVFTNHLTNSKGCDSAVTLILGVITDTSTATLYLKLFIEGLYSGFATMQPTLFNIGNSLNSNESDTIEVNLWDPIYLDSPTPYFTKKGLLLTDGNCILILPKSITGSYYYIAIKHRNAIETWSRYPILINASTFYDFSSSQSMAFEDGNNPPMKSLGNNIFGLYSGDANQDGAIDGFDLQNTENDAANFLFGYNLTDINGDGSSDGFDLQFIENNSSKFIYYARPY